MIRHAFFAAILCSLALTLGCNGNAEVKPQEGLTPEVSQEDIQAEIQRGMQAGGMADQYKGQMPGEDPKKK